MKLKKSELEPVLLTISSKISHKDQESQIGLLWEPIPLGTKRRIQKIYKAVLEEYKQFISDAQEIKKLGENDKEKEQKELKILLEEEVDLLGVEPFNFSALEQIVSNTNYDFDIIDKISQ